MFGPDCPETNRLRMIRDWLRPTRTTASERRRQAQVWRGFGGEFIVAAAEVLEEGMAGGDPGGRPELFSPRIARRRVFNRA